MYRLRKCMACDEKTVNDLEEKKQFSAQDILMLLLEIEELSDLDIHVNTLGIEQVEFHIGNLTYLITHES